MRLRIRILLVAMCLPIVLLIGLVGLGVAMEDRIVARTVEYLNAQLKVELKAESIRVSLLKGFPKGSVSLKKVSLTQGSLNWPSDFEPGLLSMEEITLRFNLLDIFKNTFDADIVILKNGWLNLYFDSKGNSNFDIFTSSESTSEGWLLNLDMVAMENVTINYIDIGTGWIFKGVIETARLRGNFATGSNSIALKTAVRVTVLRQGSILYIVNKPVSLSTSIQVTPQAIAFHSANAQLGTSRVSLTGKMGQGVGDEVLFDVQGSNVDAELLLSFLTQHQVSLPPGTKTRGKFAFTLKLVGQNSTEKPFGINLAFHSQSLSFAVPQKPNVEIRDVRGSFTNGKLGTLETSEIAIPQFEVRTKESALKGSLRLRNLQRPTYHLKVSHSLQLPELNAWGFDSPFSSGSASGNFEILGKLNNLESFSIESLRNIKLYLNSNFSNVTLHSQTAPPLISQLHGSVVIRDRDIEDARISGKFMNTHFTALAQAQNATGFLFNEGKAHVNASISIDSINTQWFSSGNAAPNDTAFSVWDAVSYFSGTCNIKSLKHNNFVARNVSGSYFVSNDRINSRNLSGEACDGLFSGDFAMVRQNSNSMQLSTNLSASGVDINKLFLSFDSFDQPYITHNNIAGKLRTDLSLSFAMSNGKLLLPSIAMVADVRVENGVLTDVEQLRQLSRFIALEELQTIRFQTLTNTIQISDQRVLIPQMDINSSALNLSLSGIHHFDGRYDYLFQVLLSDVLFRKAVSRKRDNSEFGQVEDDGSGRTKLFLKLKSDGNTSRVSYDAASAMQSFRDAVRTERRTVRELFRNEFGRIKPESTPSATTSGSKPSFGIEWEDNPKPDSTPKPPDPPQKTPSPAFGIEWEDE